MTPMHKRGSFQSCRKKGSVLPVTGDGVNDAPALKKAEWHIHGGSPGLMVAKRL